MLVFKFFRGLSSQIRGIKGTTFMGAGYVYAPFIPVLLDPEPIQGPQNWTRRVGDVESRYSTRTVNQRFYGNIRTRTRR